MFRTEGIDHVGLAVENPKLSADWYMRVLGLERRFEESWGDVPMVVGAAGTSLAFFERRPDDSPSLAGMHLAFRVDRDNFAKAKAVLEQEGLSIREADYRISRSLHVHDPDGHHLEITTYEIDDRA